MKGYAILFSSTMMIMVTAIPSITPWQLFQSMCPYLGMQSPQCPNFPYQQQQPYQQPQQQLCPNGSAPDINGNCQIIQQQQLPTSIPNTVGPPSPSTSPPQLPSTSNGTTPQP
jgi:hypothetical protein